MAKKKHHKVSAATKAKIAKALKGKKHPHKGHAMSAATRAKLSKALKGKHHKGHKMSAATRAKIAAALRARWARLHPDGPAAKHRVRRTIGRTVGHIGIQTRSHTMQLRRARLRHPRPYHRRRFVVRHVQHRYYRHHPRQRSYRH